MKKQSTIVYAILVIVILGPRHASADWFVGGSVGADLSLSSDVEIEGRGGSAKLGHADSFAYGFRGGYWWEGVPGTTVRGFDLEL